MKFRICMFRGCWLPDGGRSGRGGGVGVVWFGF